MKKKHKFAAYLFDYCCANRDFFYHKMVFIHKLQNVAISCRYYANGSTRYRFAARQLQFNIQLNACLFVNANCLYIERFPPISKSFVCLIYLYLAVRRFLFFGIRRKHVLNSFTCFPERVYLFTTRTCGEC